MLVIENLQKSFQDPDGNRSEILNISRFEMQSAQQRVLRGASGGGKTTLLNLIAGILTPDAGSIHFDGTNICRLSESGRDRFRASKIGYVFQTFNLLDGFSALENVLLGMSFRRQGSDRNAAIAMLQRVGLGERLHHRPRQLSVGQQQRVSVARALVASPRLLLADEPTANVDPLNQDTIIELLRTICRERNVALLLVTHSDAVTAHFDDIVDFEAINRINRTPQPTTA